LLSVTGLRISEVLDLKIDDVDIEQGVLTIRAAKFGRFRLAPLHPSTSTVLLQYLERRNQFLGKRRSNYVFVSNRGTRLDIGRVHQVFYALSRQTGLRVPGARNGPGSTTSGIIRQADYSGNDGARAVFPGESRAREGMIGGIIRACSGRPKHDLAAGSERRVPA
jgi:hypothetical protein